MNPKEQLEIIKSGLVDLISEEELFERLKEKKPLKIKYGADPSRPDLHLGHTVPLYKLRELQELGHEVQFIIGDFTARIGDPSFKNETRQQLSAAEVKKNAKSYEAQVFKILDKKKTRVFYNSKWLDKFKAGDFLNLTSKYTVARILERDDFSKRYQEGVPISVLEFMYPLLQGYDSVELESDVEIGGTDQKFNLLVGRELQRDWGKRPQIVLTLPIIEGVDGTQKMSKSAGNAIGIEEPANEMFGKLMSIPDSLIIRYMQYLTDMDPDEVAEAEKELNGTDVNPRHLKAKMASAIVARYHSEAAAQAASDEFDRVFKDKQLPTDIPEFRVKSDSEKLVDLLVNFSLCPSRSEAKRLIKQGAVKLCNERVSDIDQTVNFDSEVLVQCGKRKFAKFKK